MSAFPISLVDIFVISITTFCFVFGILKGLINTIFSVASYFVAFYGANRFVPVTTASVSQFIEHPQAARIISYIVLFLTFFAIMKWINLLVVRFFKFMGLATFDKIMGGILGIIKGIVVSTIAIILIEAFLPSFGPQLDESKSKAILHPITRVMQNYLPLYIEQIKPR